MRKINEINDIDRGTPEGKLLFAALAIITTESQQDKTPTEVLQQINDLSDKIEMTNHLGSIEHETNPY